MKRKISLYILAVLLLTILSLAFGVKTIYNPFTSRLDYITSGNLSGSNVTVDDLCVRGNLDMNCSGARHNITNADYINEIQFWNVTNESTNVIWTIII